MKKQDQPDPYEVLGLSRDTPLREARTRFRAQARRTHPDFVHGEAESVRLDRNRRMAEINDAWNIVEAELLVRERANSAAGQLPTKQTSAQQKRQPAPPSAPPQAAPPPKAQHWATPPPRRRTASQANAKAKAEEEKRRAARKVNPANVLLRELFTGRAWWDNRRTKTANRLWTDVRLEPVLLRLGSRTGLTLSAPLSTQSGSYATSLTDGQHLHVAQSVAGLMRLVKDRDLGGKMLGDEIRGVLAKRIRISSVAVVRGYRHDFPEMLQCLSDRKIEGLHSTFVDAFGWTYQQCIRLGLNDVAIEMSNGSALHRFYDLARKVSKDSLLFGGLTRRKWNRFDLTRVTPSLAYVSDRLAERVKWHA